MRGLTAEEREVMGIATNGDCSRCIGRFPDHLEETVTALTIRVGVSDARQSVLQMYEAV